MGHAAVSADFDGDLVPDVLATDMTFPGTAYIFYMGDRDGDGTPGACTCCPGMGNVDCDPTGAVDIADLTSLVDHLFINFPALCCPTVADINRDPAGAIDISDLTALIDHLFIGFSPLGNCP